MNPEKWKSVVIPIATYKLLKSMAKSEHRTFSCQFTFFIEKAIAEKIAADGA